MTQEIDPLQSLSTAVDAKGIVTSLFGPALSEIGIAIQGYLIPWTISNSRRIADKVKRLRDEHGINVIKSLPPRYAFEFIEGMAKEDDEKLGDMWAALISKATDPSSGYEPNRNHIDLLKKLEPLQARILDVLASRKSDSQPLSNPFDAKALAAIVNASVAHTLMALRELLTLGLVSDYWLRTFDGVGGEAEAFASDNPQSHIVLTAYGRDLVNACRYSNQTHSDRDLKDGV